MASKNLYYKILYRCFFIALSPILAGWLFFNFQTYIIGAILLIIFVSLFFELIHFLNKTNTKIAFFFEAIQNEDFTLHYPEYEKNKTIRDLNKSMNNLNKLVQKIKIEQQQQEQYFQAILEHVSIGIITVNENGLIFLSNTAAKRLLHYEHLSHIKQLDRVDHKLYKTMKEIRPGDKKLVRISTSAGDVQLSLKSTLFKTSENQFQLVAIQDIKNELEKNELDSWIKLIRVLTHEIMNTIAPITSLSETLLGHYKGKTSEELTDKSIDNTVKGLEVINERGKGLISFVDSYRKLTKLPEPDKKPVSVKTLFESISTLINNDKLIKNINIKVHIDPEDLEVIADEKQISQVLINLCKNSIEALSKNEGGKIILKGIINNQGRPQIVISDDGPGISKENIDKIFIPFYTTKESGSGIGLSLSRQIMQLHGGTLNVCSIPNKLTSMIMVF